jgi:predicted transcriptional regulator
MPKDNPKSDKTPVTIMLTRYVKKGLDQAATVTKRTRSGYVELALERQFRKDGIRVTGESDIEIFPFDE